MKMNLNVNVNVNVIEYYNVNEIIQYPFFPFCKLKKKSS